ncbi:MAG: DUF1574 family protein, partial [Leptospiraceae bacterium]|nr:DUF1574 family protein [Leptospiraceae bacterium]
VRPKYDFRNEMRKLTRQAIEEKNGGIPNPLFFQVDQARMEEDARAVMNLHFSSPQPALTQIQFFKLALSRLQKEGIPVLIYWPIVSPSLQTLLDYEMIEGPDGFEALLDFHRRGIRQSIEAERKKGASIVFAGPDDWGSLQCRAFVDSTHLSGACFDELTKLVFGPILPALKNKDRN